MAKHLRIILWGRPLWGCVVVILTLVGLNLAVPVVYAKSTTEKIEIENGEVEINRTDNRIVSIKKIFKKKFKDGNTSELEEKWEYDKDGKCVKWELHSKNYITDKSGQYVLNDEQHEWRQFDSQGRTVSYKNNLIYHTPTRKLNEIVTMTNSWSNGTVSVTSATRRDELTGKEAILKPTEEELRVLFFHDQKIARPASENLKDLLNQKREWELKKQFGGPDATTPAPIVPGRPVVPGEYGQAPVVPGAYAATPVSMVPAVPDPSFYVGLFGGASLTGVNGLDADYSDFNAFASLTGKKNLPCASSTMMSGGFRLGTWGNWGVAPEWTKYLGFGMDFTYQKLDINTGMGTYTQTIHPFGVTQFGNVNFSSNGYLATLGFMVNARYGFLPDDNISRFGTVQPFLGAGPVLSFASVEPKVTIDGDFVRQFGRQSSVFPGFGVEAGVRYLPHRNIYLEASYRFFYGQPSFDSFNQQNFKYSFNPGIATHNFRFGVGLLF